MDRLLFFGFWKIYKKYRRILAQLCNPLDGSPSKSRSSILILTGPLSKSLLSIIFTQILCLYRPVLLTSSLLREAASRFSILFLIPAKSCSLSCSTSSAGRLSKISGCSSKDLYQSSSKAVSSAVHSPLTYFSTSAKKRAFFIV